MPWIGRRAPHVVVAAALCGLALEPGALDSSARAVGTRHVPVAASKTSRTPPIVRASASSIRVLASRPGSRATLVNIWATWCVPCREEFPALLRVARSHAREGARLVLVSADFDDQMPAIRRFLAAHGVNDTTYLKFGGDMEFINGLSPRWSGALPATFIYDSSGRLADFWEGIADSSRFDRSLKAVLEKPPTGKEPVP